MAQNVHFPKDNNETIFFHITELLCASKLLVRLSEIMGKKPCSYLATNFNSLFLFSDHSTTSVVRLSALVPTAFVIFCGICLTLIHVSCIYCRNYRVTRRQVRPGNTIVLPRVPAARRDFIISLSHSPVLLRASHLTETTQSTNIPVSSQPATHLGDGVHSLDSPVNVAITQDTEATQFSELVMPEAVEDKVGRGSFIEPWPPAYSSTVNSEEENVFSPLPPPYPGGSGTQNR